MVSNVSNAFSKSIVYNEEGITSFFKFDMEKLEGLMLTLSI
jgi:hypothetical protein